MLNVIIFFIFILTGCSLNISDPIKIALSLINKEKEPSLILIKNSTSEDQKMCETFNQIIIRKTEPSGLKLFCRDKSLVTAKLGPICEGGVEVKNVNILSDVVECDNLSICGIFPTTNIEIQKQIGEGKVSEIYFSNLPWGCSVDIEYSSDKDFKTNVKNLKFYISPPDCPFCPTQNKKTCLYCENLKENERIIAGQVVFKQCSSDCEPCKVLHKEGETVEHGKGKVYYKNSSSTCELKCANQSLLRICNNGFWQGDPAYEFPQCEDTVCGCKLPNDTVGYSHGTTINVYKYSEPPCGIECGENSLTIKCNDGTWERVSDSEIVSEEQLKEYKYKSCSKRICHCIRPNRAVIADGDTGSVYSKNIVSCTETCDDFKGTLTCNSGNLSSPNPEYLNYPYDNCEQEYCGCGVNLANNEYVLLPNGSSMTLFQYERNSYDIPDACTNSNYQKIVSCSNKILTSYDSNIFKYRNCTTYNLDCIFTEESGNKINVSHNSEITVTKNPSPDCGENCDQIKIHCLNMVFKKVIGNKLYDITDSELMQYKVAAQCIPKDCDCRVYGWIIEHGGSLDFYKSDKITNCNLNGCEEAKTTISCSEGVAKTENGEDLSLYKYRSCLVIRCGCPSPFGGTIEDGKTIKVYKYEKSTCQSPLLCQDENSFKLLQCDNGVLKVVTNNGLIEGYDKNEFKFQTCSPEICSCEYNNLTVPFDQEIWIYRKSKADAGERCESIGAKIKCNNGGIWSSDVNMLDYPFTSCTDFNDDGSGGGTGGGTGNDEGPGSAIKKRFGLSDGGGGADPWICTNFANCRTNIIYVIMKTFPKKPCVLPWGGGEIEFYGSISAFDTTCVVKPDKCSNHRIVRMCHYPQWSGSDSYRFPSCEEKDSCP